MQDQDPSKSSHDRHDVFGINNPKDGDVFLELTLIQNPKLVDILELKGGPSPDVETLTPEPIISPQIYVQAAGPDSDEMHQSNMSDYNRFVTEATKLGFIRNPQFNYELAQGGAEFKRLVDRLKAGNKYYVLTAYNPHYQKNEIYTKPIIDLQNDFQI